MVLALTVLSAILHEVCSILLCCNAVLFEHEAILQCLGSFLDLEDSIDPSRESAKLHCMHA